MAYTAPSHPRAVRASSHSASARHTASPLGAAPALKLAGLAVGGLLALLVLAVAAFEIANWDKIAPGVSVLGQSVGGMSKGDAATRLQPTIKGLLAQPLHVRGGGQEWTQSADQLGLRLDAASLADDAYQVGRQGNPVARLGDQLSSLTHGRDVTASTSTDQSALDASLSNMASQIQRNPANAQLKLGTDGSVQYAPSQTGLSVDVAASRQQLTRALSSGNDTVDLVTNPVPPAIGDDQVQPARDQLARLLGSGDPFTLTFGNQQWQLSQSDIVSLLSVKGGDQPGQPASIQIDDKPLQALAHKVAGQVNQDVQDARLNFIGGSLKVLRPSQDGRTLDEAATVNLIKNKLLAGERTAELPITVTKPAVSSDNLSALGITELIDRGSTSFAGSVPEKAWNIKLAADRLNGVVVPPGGTFSFNKEVGPTTLDAGFKWGFGITTGESGPQTVPSVAGGICQVATTLFQPVFWSGYQLEERYSHAYWIPSYASHGVVGLDVTVDSDAGLDFKWTNTTSNYVLIQSATDDSNIYFALYGKKPDWNVSVDDAVITNKVPPSTTAMQYQPDSTMEWGRTLLVETAREGFDVTVVRKVTSPDSSTPRVLTLKTSYDPALNMTLVGTADKPAGADPNALIDKLQSGANAAATATAAPKPTPESDASPTAAPKATPAGAAAPTSAPTAAAKPTTAATTAPTSAPAGQPKPTVAATPKPAATPAPTARAH